MIKGAMESGDWRAQLQRQRVVNKIMGTLMRHLPFTEYERLQELKKIAERVEEEIYIAATNESEYTRKICFMMLSIDTRLHNLMRPKSGASYNLSTNGGDWQEEVYQKLKTMKDLYLYGEDWQEGVYLKIKAMKDLYLQDFNYMHQKVLSKLHGHEHNSLQQQNYEQIKKLKLFNNMLERFMQFLQIPKHGILVNYKDRLPTYEVQIISVLNSNKRKPAPPQQQAKALPPPHVQSLQQSQQLISQLTHRDMQQRLATAGDFQNQNVIDMQKPLCPQKRAMPDSTSLDSTAHTSNQNSEDWQEAVYQKIKAMKELYLPDLNYMHQKILSKLQQHDSLPQLKNEQIEKMKVYKNMLERFMQFLQIPKHGILANYRDKLGTYEKQIISVISSIRRNPVAAQQ